MSPEVKTKKTESVAAVNQPKSQDVIVVGPAKKSKDYLNNFMAA